MLTLDDIAALAITLDPTAGEQLSGLANALDMLLADMPADDPVHQALSSFPRELRRVAADNAAPDEGAAIVKDLSRTLELILDESADDGASPATGEAEGDFPASGQGAGRITIAPGIDEELVSEFIQESLDHIENAEHALLALEADPTDGEAINVVFRAFHTIKGSSAFLGLIQIESLAHHAETLLSQVRDGTVVFSSAVADLVFQAADLLRALLDGVRGTLEGQLHTVPEAFDDLLATLKAPHRATSSGASGGQHEAPSNRRHAAPAGPANGGQAAPARPGAGDDNRGPEQQVPGNEDSVRIRVGRLDHLVDLVGELVVAHSMLADDIAAVHDRARIERILSRCSKILRELQDLATALRMIPLRPAFHKVARVARDAARKNGKLIQLVTHGEDTELDRKMVSALADPLLHMVRNAIDHGIESPEERRAAGKPEAGMLRMAAYHSGGNVVVEVADDGRGLDREKISARARERGIIDSDKGLSDNEILQLIFAPGFSTAESVTAISGRGVGMDVVKKAVESLRGRIEIHSTPGEGTRFEIRLPLTLAITDGILVRVGTERYILPTIKVQMSYRPAAESISTIGGRGEMVLLHDQVLPIVRLHELFDVEPTRYDPAEAILVVIADGVRRCALLVDEVLGQQQFVVKALNGRLTNVPGIAGGAIMGDGTVGLILDTDGLLSIARSSTGEGAGQPAA